MFNWLLSEKHAISILIRDHEALQDIFNQFKMSETPATRKALSKKAVDALQTHTLVEEGLFYPAVRRQVGDAILNEACEEHRVMKLLIADLSQSESADHRDARFTVLSEFVGLHIREEEKHIFPRAKDLQMDFEALGERILVRKTELFNADLPADRQYDAVTGIAGSSDLPATPARQKNSFGAVRRRTLSPDSRHRHKNSDPTAGDEIARV